MRRPGALALALTVAAAPAAGAGLPGGAPPGASACSGCHALRGVGEAGLPPIFGRPADEIVAALAAFRSGARPATVMNRIAPGFTDDESRAIAAWISAQAPGP